MPGAAGVRKLDGRDGGAEAFGGGHSVGAVGVGEDDGELFATEAGGFAEGGGDAVGDDVGDLAEAVIAVDVAEEVVVLLEEVDINHEEGKGLVGEEGAAPFFLEALVEAAAVGEAGEAIKRGEAAIAGFALLERDFELGALFEQSRDEEAGEEGDGKEDLDNDNAMTHAVVEVEHERAVAVDGEGDGDQGDDADGEDGAGESEAEDDQEERGKDEEDEGVLVVGEDEEGSEEGTRRRPSVSSSRRWWSMWKKPGRRRMKVRGAMMDMPRTSPRYQVRTRVSQGPALTKRRVQEAPRALVTAVAPTTAMARKPTRGRRRERLKGLPKK